VSEEPDIIEDDIYALPKNLVTFSYSFPHPQLSILLIVKSRNNEIKAQSELNIDSSLF